MTNKDDVVIGCVTNYDFDAIRPWVNSLDRCGFVGAKMMVVYNAKKELVNELTKRNYTVFAFSQNQYGDYKYADNFSIVVERFFHQWAFLKQHKGKFRYMLATDVKDVIFQRNPSEYFEDTLADTHFKINAASESIKYKDEAWGADNLEKSFGSFVYNQFKENVVVNAGTLSGEFDTLVDLFLNVYMVSVGGKTHNPDQAAVNLLLSQSPYKEVTRISTPQDAWACQAGTTHDPNKIGQYLPLLTNTEDAKSYMQEDGFVYNANDDKFFVVHQYDRVPYWKELILRKYGE
jgi:hypothetical protein